MMMNMDAGTAKPETLASEAETQTINTPLADAPSFIEVQFPVAQLSIESYAERRANQGQSLTSLGKWWGRKPLILVRAALLGLLLPSSGDPAADGELFLKLLTMDADGLYQRKDKSIPLERLISELLKLSPSIQRKYLEIDLADGSWVVASKLSPESREELEKLVFDRLPYSEQVDYCRRPEQIEGPTATAWHAINARLGTSATSLEGLVEQLGERRYGRRPKVGDAFCGGGSIPFEAARLGCDVYGSDLNPVAALLTWAALHIAGGDENTALVIEEAQKAVFEEVNRQILDWGIEQNSLGWRADAYLYCTEVIDPESGWRIPLASSWVVAPKSRTVAKLIPDEGNKCYTIQIHSNVAESDLVIAVSAGTIKNSRIFPPNGSQGTPIEVIRRNLQAWDRGDFAPQPDDVFQERLYCIRWVETYKDSKGKLRTRRHYRAPTQSDLEREAYAADLLKQRITDWQLLGYVPCQRIEPGAETARLRRERGWTYWYHLFTPRQLLIIGLLQEKAAKLRGTQAAHVVNLLAIGRYADWSSKLCRWGTGAARESIGQTFSNQALNTLYSFANKAFSLAAGTWFIEPPVHSLHTSRETLPLDCRQVNTVCDVWITDPPYADAVNYHELSEFFLAWYDQRLRAIFPTWYSDSKRPLAVQGSDRSFRESMVECYRRLAERMSPKGAQIVMFTQQDISIWADLAMILWAADLAVTAAWCIQTEREAAGTREGNYVQGTVLLVLRKRKAVEAVFLDEISPLLEVEVRRQLDSMRAIDDDSVVKNFDDTDFQLAAYAAALRVLTAQPIYEIDPMKELGRVRIHNEVGPVEQQIRNAVKIACDHLVPRGFDGELWKTLAPLERFYLKGLEVESHGEHRSGVYQELARGFGAADYTDLLASSRANETRLKCAGEFGRRQLSGSAFGATLLRQVLFAVYQAARSEETHAGLSYLKTELEDYWNQRTRIADILAYLARLRGVESMPHWESDAAAAGLLAGAVRNDHV